MRCPVIIAATIWEGITLVPFSVSGLSMLTVRYQRRALFTFKAFGN